MRQRILLLVTFFLVSHYAYSQHVANAMPLDIPLNSTKESAIKKLLNKGFELSESYDVDGCLLLNYEKEYYDYSSYSGYYEYHRRVLLYCKNGKVAKVSWRLLIGERPDIVRELKTVYDLKPYAETDDDLYFLWKGSSLIVSWSSLDILSNADAAKRYQKKNQEIERREQERIEKERLEQEKNERERQEQIRKENERKERERKEAEKRQREARIKELKSKYSSCRFLFATEDRFVSCITQDKSNAVENEIKALIEQKMDEISNVIVKGTEFKDNYDARSNMERICNISNSMRTISPTIASYAENKMENFVTSREKLNKAYDKAKKKDPNLKCSEFLTSYINDIKKNSMDNKKSSSETINRMSFLTVNVACSIAPQTSFGLTVGSAKKFGWYANIISNFRFNKADYECDYLGTINDLDYEYSYSGKKKTSRLGATAGMVFRISDLIYAYAGGGYGLRNVFWELENGKWAKCTDDSYQGVAIDAGLIMSFGDFGISLGAQTIGVKYIEAKIGIGFTLKGK